MHGIETKIIPISPEFALELEINKAKHTSQRKCYGQHRNITVDDQTRTVTCQTCGYAVDPFDYLSAWAASGDRRMEALKAIEIRIEITSAEHDDLMRKVKNMRATLIRRGHPQPDVERQHFDRLRWNPHTAHEPSSL